MSDSSDEDFPGDWQPYSQRSEWSDIKGIDQDDGENPVVSIAYTEKFKDVYNYFRAILIANEKSERALKLTADAVKLNPANYTVWQYRRDILKVLEDQLENELCYVEDVINNNPKNYQVWHHRRVIVDWLKNPSRELELTEKVLMMDAKNYHAWQHRQWAIKTFDLYEDELLFVDRLLSKDIRNNSAWNQRIFVLKYFGLTSDIITREISYTLSKIEIVKNNESAWNFLRGIMKHNGGKLSDYPEVSEYCENLYNNQIHSPYLIAFLIDVYEEKCLNSSGNDRKQYLTKVYDLCTEMQNKHDVIRQKYWEYFYDRLKEEIEENSS